MLRCEQCGEILEVGDSTTWPPGYGTFEHYKAVYFTCLVCEESFQRLEWKKLNDPMWKTFAGIKTPDIERKIPLPPRGRLTYH